MYWSRNEFNAEIHEYLFAHIRGKPITSYNYLYTVWANE